MRPQFFGSAARQLFGVHHEPAGERTRDRGVLVCYPGPQEYMRTHWALRKLAASLAREGFHVLRFDYYATGDSAGDSREGSLAAWVDDVKTAAEELRDLAGVRRLSAVGLRLGATLAARAAASGLALEDLVMWEPVVSGARYLAELHAVQEARHADLVWDPVVGADELLGLPLPKALRAETLAIDLAGGPPPPAGRLVLAASSERPDHALLRARFAAAGADVEHLLVPESAADNGEGVMLSSRVQAAIVAALCGSAA